MSSSTNNKGDIKDSSYFRRSSPFQTNQQKEKQARRDAEDRLRDFNYAKSIGTEEKDENVKPLSSIAQRYLNSLRGDEDDSVPPSTADAIDQERQIAAVSYFATRQDVSNDVKPTMPVEEEAGAHNSEVDNDYQSNAQDERSSHHDDIVDECQTSEVSAIIPDGQKENVTSHEVHIDSEIEDKVDNTTTTIGRDNEDDVFHDAVEKEKVIPAEEERIRFLISRIAELEAAQEAELAAKEEDGDVEEDFEEDDGVDQDEDAVEAGDTSTDVERKSLSSITQWCLNSFRDNLYEQEDDEDNAVPPSTADECQTSEVSATIPDEQKENDRSYEEYIDSEKEDEVANTTATIGHDIEDDVFHDAALTETGDTSTDKVAHKESDTANLSKGISSDVIGDVVAVTENDHDEEADDAASQHLPASDCVEISIKRKEDDEDGNNNNKVLNLAAAVASAAVATGGVASAIVENTISAPYEGEEHVTTTNTDFSDVSHSTPENEAVYGDCNIEKIDMSTTCIDGEEEVENENEDAREDGSEYVGTVVGFLATGILAHPTKGLSDHSDRSVADEESQVVVTGLTSTPQDDKVSPPAQDDLSSEDDAESRTRRHLNWLFLLSFLFVVVVVVTGMGVGVDRGLNSVDKASVFIPLPTHEPSVAPSLSAVPSNAPSATPSSAPSIVPSATPSAVPTLSSAPSSQPSDQPSLSTQPSAEPSMWPSISVPPTSLPSESPSSSTRPSGTPSTSPSISTQPSSSAPPTISRPPSFEPSAAPTSLPSFSPSSSPTSQPSYAPSLSNQPSSMPSLEIEPFRTYIRKSLRDDKQAEKLYRERSYQYKSMIWVYYETDFDNYTDEERLQLWALACFYDATMGVSWDYDTNWMTISENVNWCDWYGLTCNDFGMVTKLELPKNNVQRNIPAEMKVLPSLQYLGLAENSIGRLESGLFEIETLEVIDLDSNGIQVIPDDIDARNQVKELYLSGNRIKEIPESILMLSKLEVLWLYTNLLEGSIPAFMGKMSNLSELDLEDNFLTGDLWPTAEMKSLEYFYVFDNILGGQVTSGPSSLEGNTAVASGDLETSPVMKCLTLKALDMSTNYWYGTIPAKFTNMVNMEELYLEDNELSGIITPEIFSLVRLHTLFLGSNFLSSTIPFEIGNARSLKSFHADNNYRENDNGLRLSKGIYGPLPATMLNLEYLEELVLDNNYVEGTIMTELGMLEHLSRLNLALNMLQGPIPSSVQNLRNLKDFRLWGNYMTGTLPNDLSLELKKLQIHDNSFIGTIPSEWGRCHNLTILDVSYNDLTGPVPTEFGNLVDLREFYSEFNMLYGFMPKEICLLRRESDLDVLSANCDVPREDTPPPTLRPTRRPTRQPTSRPTSESLIRHRMLQKNPSFLTGGPSSLPSFQPTEPSSTNTPTFLPPLSPPSTLSQSPSPNPTLSMKSSSRSPTSDPSLVSHLPSVRSTSTESPAFPPPTQPTTSPTIPPTVKSPESMIPSAAPSYKYFWVCTCCTHCSIDAEIHPTMKPTKDPTPRPTTSRFPTSGERPTRPSSSNWWHTRVNELT